MSTTAEAALGMARSLVHDAVWHGGRCTWVGPTPELRSGRIEMVTRSLTPDLYGGTAGVGLALSEVAAVTGDAGCRAAAAGALRQSLSRAHDVDPRLRLGMFTGLPGIALAAVRGGIALGQEELVDGGRGLVRGIGPSDPDRDSYDLIGGRAGAVVALVGVARAVGDPEPVDRAAALGRDLLAAAAERGGWSWPHGAPGTGIGATGIAHGVAGVAAALLELWSATGEDGFGAAAGRAIAEEQRLFDERIGNWRRPYDVARVHRPGTTAPEAFVTWCHGAPGIGLARLRAWQLTGQPARRAEAGAAVRVTSRWVRAALDTGRGDLCLCHGVAGNAEILRTYGQALGPEGAASASLAAEVAEWIVEEVAGERPRAGDDSPCLMTGRAGIARFLLGAHEPRMGSVLVPGDAGLTALGAKAAPTRPPSPR